ncbi:SDR family NAD(P)-dependent oxidoreductase [Paenibacillus oceani]|uniref:SDR family oxidoreductase n=1 Tax=Paenibacillus oceani TaxID=2772510 RepID=A0A927C714_9BACL|nr:SDR family oxidoreductase [Paenibacillus oceani]MBD2862558.1 SDR family oxidoreductase [Paenibacillus oceani]
MERFKEKTVIITGGATGIGYATARRFAVEGAHVVIAGPHPTAGEKAMQGLSDLGGNHLFIKTDVTREEEVRLLMEQTIESTGRIDVLVNNAAIFYESGYLFETTSRWRKVFDVIVEGAYLCTRYGAGAMIAHGNGIGGAIVNVSSINSSRALDKSSHYNAAKGALDQLTRCTALELSPYGIRVNGVAPGFVDAGLAVVGGIDELQTENFQSQYVEQRKIPLARPGRADEIAEVIAFLASAQASYIQGAIIPVDGGLSVTF